jgi:flagellar operon protein
VLDPNGIDRLGQVGGAGAPAPATRPQTGTTRPQTGPAFGDVLAGKLQQDEPLRFSGHALQRIERRGISLDATTMARLGAGVDRAAAKGSRSSLVVVDDSAFVVSVPNRTVITAVDREHMRDQVFTNIDSAVIA